MQFDGQAVPLVGSNQMLVSFESPAKTCAWPVLISESTFKPVKDEFDAELVGAVMVKGKTEPVNVYRVIGRKGAPKTEKLQSWQK